MTDIDNQILINPNGGSVLQFNLSLWWNGQMRLDFAHIEMTPQTQEFLGNIFTSIGKMMLTEAPTE